MKRNAQIARLLAALLLSLILSCCLGSCGTGVNTGLTVKNPYDFSRPETITMQAHAHTNASDGIASAETVIRQYAEAGYNCLAITDHDQVTWPWPIDPQGMVPVQGDEASKYKALKFSMLQNYHIASLFCDYVPPDDSIDPQTCISGIDSKDGISIISHPKLSGKTGTDIAKLNGYNGIEIYNRSAELITNKGYSTDVWDALLSTSDRPVWGYAVDDYHGSPVGLGYGKVVVFANKAEGDIKSALATGNFFSVAGLGTLRFKRITVSGQTIKVVTNEPSDITFYGRDGKPLGAATGQKSATYNVKGEEKYVRVEAFSSEEATTIYSNPFWVAKSAV